MSKNMSFAKMIFKLHVLHQEKLGKTMYGNRDVKYTTRPEDFTPFSRHPETKSHAKNKVKADFHLGYP